MNAMKRLTAFVLAMVMLLTLATPGAWVTTVSAAEHHHDHETAQVNSTSLQHENLAIEASTVQSGQPTLNANEEGTKFYDPVDAGILMRPEMVNRSEVVTAYVYTDTYDGTEEGATDLAIEVLAYATAHSGTPEEGDYLLWNLADLGCYYDTGEQDGMYLFIFEYHFTYTTTAAQEAELDTAIDALLAELNVADADNFTKLKAIYDYICANVAYDSAAGITAYDALINKTAASDGFALLMYRLALELGVDCRVIMGTLNGQDHAWNIAEIDGLYYNLDAASDGFLVCPANFTDHVRDDAYTSDSFNEYYPMATEDYPVACEHVFDAGTVTTAATCTTEGVMTYTCTLCGETTTEVIPVGDHTYGEATVVEPTCTTEGSTTYTCTVCNETITEVIPATEHTYGDAVVTEPTCTEDGSTTYTCTGCGQTITEVIPATEHSFGEGVIVEPTCTEDGYTEYTCANCGETYADTYVNKLGHAFTNGEIATAPTCTAEGVMTYTCTTCGKVLNEAIPMTEHTYDEGVATTPATCTAEGVMTYTCTGCGTSYTEVIPMTEHTYDEGVVTDPTCTEDGYTTYTCTGCGISYQDHVVAALTHSYDDGEVSVAPTCTETGITVYTCARCGNTINDITDPLGHEYDEGTITLAPTCTEEGVMTYTCIYEDDSYTEAIPALGHTKNEGVVTKEATCTETGLMTYVCTVCEVEFTEEIPMIPHDYVGGKCTVCGDIQLIAPTILSCYSKAQTSVKVTWTAVEGAEGYWLWRSTTPDDYDSWSRVKTITDPASTIYTNQGLTEGVTYYYAVQAYVTDANGEVVTSDYSNMSYMPAAVVFNGPYGNSTQRVRLLWNEVGGAHGYQIWRMNADGSYSVVKTLGDRGNELTNNMGSATAYSNDGLEAGTEYTYKMRAFMIEDGKKVFGAYSDEVTIATMPEAPVVTGTSPKATRAQLTWDAVKGAAGYQIWMAESADGEYKIVKSITDGSTSYTKYDLTSGKTYYFKVRAYTEVEGKKTFGAYSEAISITVD